MNLKPAEFKIETEAESPNRNHIETKYNNEKKENNTKTPTYKVH